MDKEFLYDMLRTPSVSGHEIALQKKVIQHMESVADEILTDATGDVISVVNPHVRRRFCFAGISMKSAFWSREFARMGC